MSHKHIMALMHSHMERDDEQFLSIALQIAAIEARQGRKKAAEELKMTVQRARDRKRELDFSTEQAPIPFARPKSELKELVESTHPTKRISDMVLSEEIEKRLRQVVYQQKERTKLRGFNQKPETHLLLVGPPGTGKTMTASVLAGELHLPLFTVRLESIFSRFLGETAGKLRLLFDQIAQLRGVYLLDEFDALGADRGEKNDIGEVRRLMNSLLTFMEEPNSTDSLVIAATNHVGILDEALARRFDQTFLYDLPDISSARSIIQQKLGKFKFKKFPKSTVNEVINGLSQGELVRATDSAIKQAILSGNECVVPSNLREALHDRQTMKNLFSK